MLTQRAHRLCWIVSAMSAFMIPPSSCFASDALGDLLVALLHARDAQFDNACLRYHYSYEQTMPLEPEEVPEWPDALRTKLRADHSIRVYHAYHALMVVRGKQVTFSHRADKAAAEQNGPYVGISPFSKRTNVKGGYWEIVDDGSSTEMLRLPAGPDQDILQWQRMSVEFALGFGFGSRIIKITSVVERDDGYLLTGAIRLYANGLSEFELEIDRSFIARRATVTVALEDGKTVTVLNITTAGTIYVDDVAIPTSGKFTRTLYSRNTSGQLVATRVEKEFVVRFNHVDWNLSDSVYEALTDMSLTAGMRVVDHIMGLRYTVGEELRDNNQPLGGGVSGGVGYAPGAPPPQGCHDCIAEWVGAGTFFGAGQSECEHGPEHDKDCAKQGDPCAGKDCMEFGNPNDPCYNPNCSCFDCSVSPPHCETQIEYWLAWCGYTNQPTTYLCSIVQDRPGQKERRRDMGAPIPFLCHRVPGSPDYEPFPRCSPQNLPIHLGCRADNCLPESGWTYIHGNRFKCP